MTPQSTIENVESNMSAPHPCQQLTRMITSYWVSRAIYIAAKLRIADHQGGLANGRGVGLGPTKTTQIIRLRLKL